MNDTKPIIIYRNLIKIYKAADLEVWLYRAGAGGGARRNAGHRWNIRLGKTT
jgi:hypothetical protein